METKRRSFCPISSALDFLGDKWTLLIIRDIVFKGKNTYGDFLNSEEGIATNILADRLARLEAYGILEKHEYPENKVKHIYWLTQKGLDLIPVLFDMILWSDTYMEISANGHSLAEKLRADREGYQKALLERLKPQSSAE